MRIDLDLDGFFAALRSRGLRVGVEEALRLRYVLARIAEASRPNSAAPRVKSATPPANDLKPAIASLIVKSAAQVQSFNEVFDAWEEHIARLVTEVAHENKPPSSSPDQKRQGDWANELTPRRPGSSPWQPQRRSSFRAVSEVFASILRSWRRPVQKRDLLVAVLGLSAALGADAVWTFGLRRSQAETRPLVNSASTSPAVASSDTAAASSTPTSAAESPIVHSEEHADAAQAARDVAWAGAHQGRMKDAITEPQVTGAAPAKTPTTIIAAFPRFPKDAAVLAESYEAREASGEPESRKVHARALSPWPFIALVLAAIASAIWIFFRYGRRSWLPDALPVPTSHGLPWVTPTLTVPTRGVAMRLLGPADRETMVWGIGRFVSEEITIALDVPATVAATAAAGGLPELRFLYARHEREVWLWIDRSVGAVEAGAERTLERLADEVARTLTESGLVVEMAYFHGIPDELWSTDDRRFTPLEVEERRHSALIAILTDGRLLALRHDEVSQRRRIDALFRLLSGFPHLAFVDFSHGKHGLATRVAQHDVLMVSPCCLASFLGGSLRASAPPPPDERAATSQRSAPDRSWMACLALAPFPVQEELAFALREELGLGVSPWAIEAIRTRLQTHAGRLDWERRGRQNERARHLAWLRESSTQGSALKPGSLLARSLAFWKQQLDEEATRRAMSEPVGQWSDSPAALRLEFDRALLELWDEPGRAIDTLYRLHGDERTPGPLRSLVRERLRSHGARDCPHGDRAIVLPWIWSERSAPERVMLQQMDFGVDHCPIPHRESLRRSGRYTLALAGALGIALAGAGAAMWRANQRIETSTIVGGRTIWKSETRPCSERIESRGEVWHCGTTAKPTRPTEGSERTEAILLGASPSDFDARAFAVALLDSGTVDHVLWANGSAEELKLALDQDTAWSNSFVHWLFEVKPSLLATDRSNRDIATGGRVHLTSESWVYLLGRLGFTGSQLPSEVWPQAQVVGDSSAGPRIQGVGLGPTEMVWVPGGEFTMGSKADDLEANSDEKPAHRVRLDGFWMAKRETSNQEYRLVDKEKQGADELPVVEANWNQAKAFCESLGMRLPTEAEWEYAARGTDGRKYPWGSEPPDEKRALFDKSNAYPLAAVNSYVDCPGPFGTVNQAGNVWEWVADCWDTESYAKDSAGAKGKAIANPTHEICSVFGFRVLRGGSFSSGARCLRSAFRSRNDPDLRMRSLDGFRCARGSRRQPD